MKSLTHISLGSLLGALFSNDDPLITVSIIFGSLLPDADYPFSAIDKPHKLII